MTTNEIELHQPERAITNLTETMEYARAVSVAALLPQAYRGKPADIMLAMGLGQAMGLSPAESLYRIDVIQGKPTASAELIAANVRKAGHRLRVFGDDDSATAIIIRVDDPEFEFKVTRDRAWAQAMGLMGKDNYKKQFGTMLQWRAITAVARLACPEALYGVAYTPDEMTDMPGTADRPTGGLAAVLQTSGAEAAPGGESAATVPVEPESNSAPESEPIASAQLTKIGILCGELGLADPAEARREVGAVIGREIKSRKDLTKDEASRVIDRFESIQQQPFPTDEPVDGELVEDGAS